MNRKRRDWFWLEDARTLARELYGREWETLSGDEKWAVYEHWYALPAPAVPARLNGRAVAGLDRLLAEKGVEP